MATTPTIFDIEVAAAKATALSWPKQKSDYEAILSGCGAFLAAPMLP